MQLAAASGSRAIGAVVRNVSLSPRRTTGTPLLEAAAALRAALLKHRALVFSPECSAAADDGSGTLTEDELVDCFNVLTGGKALAQQGRENSRGQREEIFKVTNVHDVRLPPRISAACSTPAPHPQCMSSRQEGFMDETNDRFSMLKHDGFGYCSW